MQGRHALIVEGYFTADEHVKHNPETPDIDLGSRIHPGVQELRRGKVERSAKRREVVVRRIEIAQSKVNNLDIACLGDQDIFNLQICAFGAQRSVVYGR